MYFTSELDNPVTIAAAEVKSENLFVKISAGSGIGSNEYLVRVSSPGETVIEIFEVINDTIIFSSKYTYRVKTIPDQV